MTPPATAAGDGTDALTPEQIEAELAASRQALADSVDALAQRVSPKAQVLQATQDVREAASQAASQAARTGRALAEQIVEQAGSLAGQARDTVEGALEGDAEAVRTMKKVAVTAGGAAAVAMLLALTRRGQG